VPDITAYLARVDAQLATLDPEARDAFIDRLTEQWMARYAEFQRRVHRGAPTPAGTTSFDYIDTIAGLDQRAARVPAHA
jgi:hypothetical protein